LFFIYLLFLMLLMTLCEPAGVEKNLAVFTDFNTATSIHPNQPKAYR